MAQREVSDELDEWLRGYPATATHRMTLEHVTARYVVDNLPPLKPPCWVTWGTRFATHLWVLTKRDGKASGVSEVDDLRLSFLFVVADADRLVPAVRPEWADEIGEDDWRWPLVNDPRLDR